MCRRTMLTSVVSVALAVVVATLAYRRLTADASLAGSAWAKTTLLGWLWIGAAVGALPWLLSADGWGVLVGDLSVGILGAALGGLAAYAPGPLSVVTQRSGIFGVWLVVLLYSHGRASLLRPHALQGDHTTCCLWRQGRRQECAIR